MFFTTKTAMKKDQFFWNK